MFQTISIVPSLLRQLNSLEGIFDLEAMMVLKRRKQFCNFCLIQWVHPKITEMTLIQLNSVSFNKHTLVVCIERKSSKKSSTIIIVSFAQVSPWKFMLPLLQLGFVLLFWSYHVVYCLFPFHTINYDMFFLILFVWCIPVCFVSTKAKDISIVYQTDFALYFCFFWNKRNLK